MSGSNYCWHVNSRLSMTIIRMMIWIREWRSLSGEPARVRDVCLIFSHENFFTLGEEIGFHEYMIFKNVFLTKRRQPRLKSFHTQAVSFFRNSAFLRHVSPQRVTRLQHRSPFSNIWRCNLNPDMTNNQGSNFLFVISGLRCIVVQWYMAVKKPVFWIRAFCG